MIRIEKIDPLTGEVFVPTRSNQLFASEENRIRFHNEKAKSLRKQKAFIDRPLHVNQRILTEVIGSAESVEVHKQYLLGKGFSFSTFTHYSEYRGKHFPSVYEFVILPIGSDTFKILRNNA
jgi:hypothetical protein